MSPAPSRPDAYDVLVVGAGFAGAVMAERCAAAGARVLVVDRRSHVAGNAYDYVDDGGVLVHRYGPHIFHTNSPQIVSYLSRFSAWRPYEHRVMASVEGQLFPVPVNRSTLNQLYGIDLRTEEDAARFYAEHAASLGEIRTSEDAVLARAGRHLYETFFRGYSRKHWGVDPSQLHASVCGRIPFRTSTDDRYFTDSHQAMPAEGYTAMFSRILDHPNIVLSLATDFRDVRDEVDYRHLVYTGPIDDFFDNRFGSLPYRSLAWELRRESTPGGGLVQPVAVVNFPDERVPYTRLTEYRHLSGQLQHPCSTLAFEYASPEGDPYYPIPREDTRALYRRYNGLARKLSDVTFIGRLARYQYLNMDQVVGQALGAFRRLSARGVIDASGEDAVTRPTLAH